VPRVGSKRGKTWNLHHQARNIQVNHVTIGFSFASDSLEKKKKMFVVNELTVRKMKRTNESFR